jgi:hypothetical protein
MQKPPLYRKENTTAHGVRHRSGGNFRDERKSRLPIQAESNRTKMHGKVQRGLDYTPLFRFLLSKVKERLDKTEPIFWLVALREHEREDYVRIGESSYYSGLFVNEDGTLQVVNPSIGPSSLQPTCKCCTHTFNGTPFTKPFAGYTGAEAEGAA